MKTFLISIAGLVEGDPVTIWLTSDGTETGRPCKTAFQNADGLLAPRIGTTSVSNAGTAWNEYPLNDTNGGRGFNIQIANMKTPVFDDLKELIDALIADPLGTVTVTATGEPGDIDAVAIPWFNPVPLRFGAFSTGFVKNVEIALMTT